jgi:hypothetical protein
VNSAPRGAPKLLADIDSVEREIYRHRKAPRLPARIGRRIDDIYDRHKAHYGTRIDELARGLKASPSLYDQPKTLPSLYLFFRPHHVIELEGFGAATEALWVRRHRGLGFNCAPAE